MKKTTLLSLLILPFFISFKSDKASSSFSKATENVFDLSILQNNARVEIINHKIRLKKVPFKLEFTFHNTSEIAVSASFRDKIIKQMEKGIPLKRMKWFDDGDGLAQSPKNAGHDMAIAEEGFNYWCYLPEEMNVFDDVEFKDAGTVCTRSIDSIFIIPKVCGLAKLNYDFKPDEVGITVPVTKLNEAKIFLGIINWEKSPDGEKRFEKQRDWVEIDFE